MAGWNGSDRRGNSTPIKPNVTAKKSSPVRGLIAGLSIVVVLGGVIGYFMFSGGEGVERNERRPVRKASATAPKKTSRPADKPAVPAQKQKVEAEVLPGDPVTSPNAEAQVQEQAMTNVVAADDERKDPTKPVLGATDRLIKMVTGRGEDDMIPPLPPMDAKDTDEFIKALEKPVMVNLKDKEYAKELREHLQSVRLEIAKIMRENEGCELSAVLKEHREICNRNTELRDELKKAVGKLVDEGDTKGAAELRDAMNQALDEMGVPKVDLPLTAEEKAEAGIENEEEENE